MTATREVAAVMKPRQWTVEDLSLMEELISRGLADAVIGRRLGRTANAVNIKRKRMAIPSRRRSMLTAREITRRMGLPCSKVVAKWIATGWLKGQKGQRCGPNRMWFVREDDWLAFLEDPRGWPAWEPARLTDGLLREWIAELRTSRWLRPSEVGARYSVGLSAVNRWVRTGLLPAQRWGNWWINEASLSNFAVPYEHSRAGGKVRRFTHEEDAAIILLRYVGETWKAIADELGHNISSVFGRWQRLQAREVLL